MAKSTILRGVVILKENTLTEAVDNEILSISAAGVITKRPAIASGGSFVSSTLPSAQIIVGNGSNVATAVAMTGDIAISNAGVTSIGTGVIVNADINAAAAIAYSKLNLATSIVNADINAAAAIAYSKLNLATSIVNADINAAAAIVRTKLASGTAYRLIANNASGVMAENADLTASRVIVSDANGQLVAATPTTTEINRVTGVTANIQTQIDTIIAGNATNTLVQSPTASEDGFAITWDDGAQEWALTDPVVQGIPVGGSTRQFLGKNSGTNYDSDWLDLETADISDLSATATELNTLAGITADVTELNYVDGVTSAIQTQLDNKLGNSLAHNAIFVGNASNVAAATAAGSNGQVLTVVGGVPSWATPSVGASGGAVDELQKNDGASGFSGSGLFSSSDGNLSLGDSSLAGASRTISAVGSTGNTSLILASEGTGGVTLAALSGSTTIQGSVGNTVQKLSSATNTVDYAVKFSTVTSGSPATGIGTGAQFEVETSNGNNEIGATIEAVTTDVTGGSEDFDLVFKTMSAGAAASEKVRITSSGGIQTVGTDTNSIQGSANFIRLNTSFTNVDPQILRIQHQTDGTPAAGIGGSLSFDIETSVGNVETGVLISAVTTDVTGGSEDFDLVFKTMVAGASPSEHLRFGSNKIGLYGVTTVARATTGGAASTFVANTSLIANDSATWDGYTVGQVVKALRNIGILT